jgi:hypothetical protein
VVGAAPAGSARIVLTNTVGGRNVRIVVDCTAVPLDDEEEPEEGEGGEGGDQGDGDEEEGHVEGYRALITIADPAKPDVVQVRTWGGGALLWLVQCGNPCVRARATGGRCHV